MCCLYSFSKISAKPWINTFNIFITLRNVHIGMTGLHGRIAPQHVVQENILERDAVLMEHRDQMNVLVLTMKQENAMMMW